MSKQVEEQKSSPHVDTNVEDPCSPREDIQNVSSSSRVFAEASSFVSLSISHGDDVKEEALQCDQSGENTLAVERPCCSNQAPPNEPSSPAGIEEVPHYGDINDAEEEMKESEEAFRRDGSILHLKKWSLEKVEAETEVYKAEADVQRRIAYERYPLLTRETQAFKCWTRDAQNTVAECDARAKLKLEEITKEKIETLKQLEKIQRDYDNQQFKKGNPRKGDAQIARDRKATEIEAIKVRDIVKSKRLALQKFIAEKDSEINALDAIIERRKKRLLSSETETETETEEDSENSNHSNTNSFLYL